MKCKSCGFEIKENKKFCTNCGFKIEINLEESENKINKEKIKTINNQKYSSAKENKTKTNFIFPLVGILGFSIIAVIIYALSSYDEVDNYVDNYVNSDSWLEEYLLTNGKCCNEKFDAIKTNYGKLLVVNTILEKKPNDTKALREQKNLNRELIREKNKNSLKTFGIYSAYMNSSKLDIKHFEEFGDITYEAEVTKRGKPLNDPFSFNCRTNERYYWNQGKWKVPRSKNEKSIISSMCLRQKNVWKIIDLIKKDGWKKYGKNSWVDIKRWEESSGNNYLNYDTNFFIPSKQNLNKVSINCKSKEILFRDGSDDWSEWINPKFEQREILNDKCNF